MTDLEVKDQRILNLEKQLSDSKSQKVRNRTRIPTHSKAWVDREDIQDFFAEQVQSQRRTAEQKHQNLINLIAGRKERLVECQRKRKDAEKLEGEGRLPKRRKNEFQLKEEEAQLGKQINEAETRLRSLEIHIGDLDPRDPESMNGGQEDNTFAVGVVDHDWGRDEVNSTPTPAPSALPF